MELLSIIIPVYNSENYLRSCINSVLDQTYKKLEVILIDDGSEDSSSALCDQMAELDCRIKTVHTKNMGCSSARNIGLELARGKYVAFVDSDDVVDKSMYEILINNLESTSSDVSACAYTNKKNTILTSSNIVSSTKKEPLIIITRKKEIFDNIVGSNNSIEGFLWNKVWKKSLIGNERFNINLSFCEDCLFTWNVMKKANKVCYCNLPMYHYLMHEESSVHNLSVTQLLGALDVFQYMLSDKEVLTNRGIDNISTQLLFWDISLFNSLIQEKKLDINNYREVRNVAVTYKQYLNKIHLPNRLVGQALIRGGTNTLKYFQYL